MPQITITYKSEKSLKALKDFSKYFDFVIEKSSKNQIASANRNIILGDKSIDISELSEIFTGKKLNANQLRKDLWHR